MQCAIDNAKRTFDIDIPNEIARIKSFLSNCKYPIFWKQVKDKNDKRHNHGMPIVRTGAKKREYLDRFDENLVCPMNYLFGIDIDRKDITETIPDENFYVHHPMTEGRRKSKKVEELIEKYSLEVYMSRINTQVIGDNNNNNNRVYSTEDREEFLILHSDFDQLIKDIRNTYISGNYLGLMSWLINRTFIITPQAKGSKNVNMSKLNKNKVLLLKTLYTVNRDAFLKCYVKK